MQITVKYLSLKLQDDLRVSDDYTRCAYKAGMYLLGLRKDIPVTRHLDLLTSAGHRKKHAVAGLDLAYTEVSRQEKARKK
jgi:hypothetical protein